MDPARRRAFRWLVVPFATAVVAMFAVALAPPASAQSSLRQAAGAMRVGVAVTPELLNNSTYANIVRTEFSSLTAENQMKWETVQPSPGSFNFNPGRQIINFAQQNNQMVYGHTLVWHSQTPQWVRNLNGTQMRQAMQNHITTVMQEFSTVNHWDVVNEVMGDNAQLRQEFWLNAMGPSYIADAFRFADAAQPNDTLCMNDYNIDGINAKSNAYYSLVQQLLSQGVPIDCMSFQAHLIVGQVPSNMRENMQRFANLGLKVWVTELDIRIPRPVSQQQLQQQAQDFGRVFTYCLNLCEGLTVWGLHDAQSWVDSTFPEYDAPLMWDDNMQRKPAYYAALQALGDNPSPPPPPPPSTSTAPPPPPPPSTSSAPPPGGSCRVVYSAADWGGAPGFTANVIVTNTGSSTINGWTLQFTFPAGQSIREGWSATWSQQGSTVTATNLDWNRTLPPGQSTTIGFNGAMTAIGNNPSPTSFTLNGSACTS